MGIFERPFMAGVIAALLLSACTPEVAVQPTADSKSETDTIVGTSTSTNTSNNTEVDTEDSSNPTDPTDPLDPVDPTNPISPVSMCDDLVEAGKNNYYSSETNCSLCHGDMQDSGFSTVMGNKQINVNNYLWGSNELDVPLNQYIEDYMNNAGVCVGDCAESVAVYLTDKGGNAWCPSDVITETETETKTDTNTDTDTDTQTPTETDTDTDTNVDQPLPPAYVITPSFIPAQTFSKSVGEDAKRDGEVTQTCQSTVDENVDMLAVGDECAIGYTRTGEALFYTVNVSKAGRYDISVWVSTGKDTVQNITVKVDGDVKKTLEVVNNGDSWTGYEKLTIISALFKEGDNELSVEFVTGGVNLKSLEVTGESIVNFDLPGDISKGKTVWDEKCSECHILNKAFAKSYSMAELAEITHRSMPIGLHKPSDCVYECAENVATYIMDIVGISTPRAPGNSSMGFFPDSKEQVQAIAVSITRLNEEQFNNTVRDLFGTAITLNDDYPFDAEVSHFNNIAEALFITDEHVNAFDATIFDIVEEAFAGDKPNKLVVECDINKGDVCAKIVARVFGLKAWRRPLTAAEITSIGNLYNDIQAQTNDKKESFKMVVMSMMLSPNFIFRAEIDNDLNSETGQPLSNFELATRLSYFLWGSTPDDELLQAATDNELLTDAGLEKQVQRMLVSPKADYLIDSFSASWLGFEFVQYMSINEDLYPKFNDDVANAMVGETRTFMQHIFNNNRPISEIITANYTFLNKTMADFYGESGNFDNNYTLHNWSDETRNGVMGQASILTMSSGPADEPAPVSRGLWTLERMICKEPPKPSDDTMELFPILSDDLVGRERLVEHRANPECASCHVLMDPIGFAQDNFDKVGLWRDEAHGLPIDSSGVIPHFSKGLIRFDGPKELAEVLTSEEDFAYCLVKHMSTFALARNVELLGWVDLPNQPVIEPKDYAFINKVVTDAGGKNSSMRDIITAIVTSDAFRQRQGANTLMGEAQ